MSERTLQLREIRGAWANHSTSGSSLLGRRIQRAIKWLRHTACAYYTEVRREIKPLGGADQDCATRKPLCSMMYALHARDDALTDGERAAERLEGRYRVGAWERGILAGASG
jgi:hypothetical protein